MIFFWQVDLMIWQVNIKIWQVYIIIWQVDIIIWKVMAEICHHNSGIHGYDIYIRFAFPLRCTTYLGHSIYAIYSRDTWSHWYWRMNISIKIYISWGFNLTLFFICNVYSSLFLSFKEHIIFISLDNYSYTTFLGNSTE